MEYKRKIVHISMIVFALLIGHVPPIVISITCLLALLFNIFLLPAFSARSLEREEDRLLGFSPGLIIYPGVLLLISIIFLNSQVFLLIGWGAMAFGDGFTSLLGRKWGRHALQWNPQKSWEGFFFFLIFSFPLSILLMILQPEELRLGQPLQHWMMVIMVSHIFAAIWESIPDTLDDNFVVPMAAAVSAFYAHEIFISGKAIMPEINFVYLGLAGLLGLGSIMTDKISLVGAVVGTLITFTLMQAFGILGLLSIGVFFVSGTAVSVWNNNVKQELGLAEARQGKRSYENVLANAATAFFLAILAIFLPAKQEVFEVLMMTTFAAALSDTVSSEVGNVYGTRFINILTLKRGRRGDDGMISLEGTLSGILASALMGTIFWAFTAQIIASLVITVSGFFGNLMDSVLGSSLQRRGFLNNHTVNFFNTLLAVLLAALLITE